MVAEITRGQIVASRRGALNLTQEALAHLCGCSLRTIQRIESSANTGMSQRMVKALHRHLNLSLEELAIEKSIGSKRSAP